MFRAKSFVYQCLILNFRRPQWKPDTFRVWFFHMFRFIWKAKMKLKVVLFPKAQLCEKSDSAVPARLSVFVHSFNNLLLIRRLFQTENCSWILTEISFEECERYVYQLEETIEKGLVVVIWKSSFTSMKEKHKCNATQWLIYGFLHKIVG